MNGKRIYLPLLTVIIWALSVISASATCTTNTSLNTEQVKICAPASGSSDPTTFHFSGASSSPNGIHVSQIYIDGVKYSDYFVADVEVNLTLTPGTHRLTFQAIDKKSLKVSSTENITVASATTAPPPPPTPSQVTLQWSPSTSSGVDSYIVYRSTTSGSGYSEAGTASSTSFVDKPGSGTFYYVVAAVSPQGESKYSNQVAVTLK